MGKNSLHILIMNTGRLLGPRDLFKSRENIIYHTFFLPGLRKNDLSILLRIMEDHVQLFMIYVQCSML